MHEYITKKVAKIIIEHAATKENAILMIDDALAADVVPARRGKWEHHFSRPGVFADLYWHCSACGAKQGEPYANLFKHCPECGARMRRGQDE